jgi:hypothetical protein
MNIESPQYQNDPLTGQENHCIKATINGMTAFIPIDLDNTDYAEILRQVAAGTLTIEEAD